MQGGKRPTKAQQDWQDWQRLQGCANCGAAKASVHHCVGSTAKHNKVHIGQWFTIPLCYGCHQGDCGIHGNMAQFHEWAGMGRKEIEKGLFLLSVDNYQRHGCPHQEPPMSDEVINAIMDYRR